MCKHRPSAKIIAMTPFKEICRRLSIIWGVVPILVDNHNSVDDIPEVAKKVLKINGWVKKGDRFVVTGGSR